MTPLWVFVFALSVCSVSCQLVPSGQTRDLPPDVTTMDIKMKNASPSKHDDYLCSAFPVSSEEHFIVKFEAMADVKTAHHILVYGCEGEPFSADPIWQCPAICSPGIVPKILFAWAKNAPATKLPKDVGFRLGGVNGIRNIVLQVHYKHKLKENAPKDTSGIKIYLTEQKQKYVAGIFLLASARIDIPPNTPMTHSDISCTYKLPTTMYPFAYRTHAHALSTVITGYQYNNTWHEIGKGNPQWPQAFYPVKELIEVKPNDILVARCSFNSTGKDTETHAGMTGGDEMCNFYIMFYTDSKVNDPYGDCGYNSKPQVVKNIPADSDVPLPPNPLLEEKAKGHSFHGMPPVSEPVPQVQTLDLKMKGAKPLQHDAYLCASYPVPKEEHYIVKFEAMADVQTAHHIIIYGCMGDEYSTDPIWNCPPVCKDGQERILFAWAKNAPPTVLPKDVGFRVGGKLGIKTLVLQVHYAHAFEADSDKDYSGIKIYLTQQKQKFVAGIFLLMAYEVTIPPNTPKVYADISCVYNLQTTMHPFGYRTHAHGLGKVITGYQFNNSWHEIGKGNPQWPQMFYPVHDKIEVLPGDKLVARCTFNSTGRNRFTYIGATGADEMCNFYIMFYTDGNVQDPYGGCGGNNYKDEVGKLPADSDVPLPPNPLLEEIAKGRKVGNNNLPGHQAGNMPSGIQNQPLGGMPSQNQPLASMPSQNQPLASMPSQNQPFGGMPSQNSPANFGPSQNLPSAPPTPPEIVYSISSKGEKTMDLKMKGAKPLTHDQYLCASYPLEEKENYIVKFEAMADVMTAHHIIVFGCAGQAYSTDAIWHCPAVCSGNEPQKILFAWAKNAPPTILPNGVGFRVGGNAGVKTLVLQVHYAHAFEESDEKDYSGIKIFLTEQKQQFVAGIFLMLKYQITIPPNTPMVHADISCVYQGEQTMYPFAYRTHAHGLGKVITGYQFNNSWHEIGKGNPQWPQAFYPVHQRIAISRGDKLVARCSFNSTGRDRFTYIGQTGRDEMCNFYIMVYMDDSVKNPYGMCGGNQLKDLVSHIPADSDVPLPPNPLLEKEAKGQYHGLGVAETGKSYMPTNIGDGEDFYDRFNVETKGHYDSLGVPETGKVHMPTDIGGGEPNLVKQLQNNNFNKDTKEQYDSLGVPETGKVYMPTNTGDGNREEIHFLFPKYLNNLRQLRKEKQNSKNVYDNLNGKQKRDSFVGDTKEVPIYLNNFGKLRQEKRNGKNLYDSYNGEHRGGFVGDIKDDKTDESTTDSDEDSVDTNQNGNKSDKDQDSAYTDSVESGRHRNRNDDTMQNGPAGFADFVDDGHHENQNGDYSQNDAPGYADDLENGSHRNRNGGDSQNDATGYQDSVQNGRHRNRNGGNLRNGNLDNSDSADDRENGGDRISDDDMAGNDAVGKNRNRNKAFQAMNEQISELKHGKKGNPPIHHSPTSTISPVHKVELTTAKPAMKTTVLPSGGDRTNTTTSLLHLTFDSNWPQDAVTIGQVAGVASDKDGNVYVFHRGSRVWDAHSFDVFNRFQLPNAISEDTIVIYDKNGKFIRKFGNNLFFMPHGMEVDDKGNMWITDVALHQVMRIPAGKSKPDLVLGERFKPGSDDSHFCKPTDIAVLPSGEFFVADGYCNSRIMKFTKNGKLIKQWGHRNFQVSPPAGTFNIPHSITLVDDHDQVCVADRENGRVQCFDLEGKFKRIIKVKEFGDRLFAIDYCPLHGGLLFAVNGPMFDANSIKVTGFTLNFTSGSVIETWTPPQGLSNPHDVCVDSPNHAIYVGELDPTKVWRMQMESARDLIFGDKVISTSTKTVKKSDFTPSVIIGVLLVVPVVILLVVMISIKLYHSGKIKCFSGGRNSKVFSLQNILPNSHRGFDRLSTEESDHEVDDSDQEEFTAPLKQKA